MAKLSDHVFPESVWKAFGEHVEEEAEDLSSDRLGSHLGPSSAVLEAILDRIGRSWRPLGAILEVSWAVMRSDWRPLGPSWGDLGGLLGRLGLSEGRKEANANICQTPKGNQWFLPLRALLEDVLGAYLGPLGPSWAILKASWADSEPSWSHLGPSWWLLRRTWRHLEPSWANLEAILGHPGCRAVLEDLFRTLRSFPGLPRGRRDGPKPQGEFFWKRTKTKTGRIQHARHPCDKSTGGGG